MKTKIVSTIVYLSITFSSFGQYRMVEGEIGFGLPLYRAELQGETNATFLPSSIFGELGFNIPGSHFSPGVQIYIGGWEVDIPDYLGTSDDLTVRRGLRSIMPVFDYNFNEIKNFIRPFAGFGIGYAQLEYETIWTHVDNDSNGKIIFAPRIGVEFWSRARLTLSYHMTTIKDFNSLNLNIGFVFGGGKIKE